MNLEYDGPLSSFGFNCNVRRYAMLLKHYGPRHTIAARAFMEGWWVVQVQPGLTPNGGQGGAPLIARAQVAFESKV